MDLLDTHNNIDRSNRFRDIADKISQLAANYAVPVRAYHSPELPLFNAQSAEKQAEIIEQSMIFLRTLEVTIASGARLDANDKALWGALSTLGFVPPSDLFHRFEPDDAIEIYDLQGIQIWRNLNCMKICSYTLEEMYSIEWFKRYNRDEKISQECQVKVAELLSGLTPDIYDVNLAEHVVEETMSSDRFVISLKISWIARFKNSNSQLNGFVVVSKANVLGKKETLETKPKPSLRLVESQPQAFL